jgi:hypothetical protein
MRNIVNAFLFMLLSESALGVPSRFFLTDTACRVTATDINKAGKYYIKTFDSDKSVTTCLKKPDKKYECHFGANGNRVTFNYTGNDEILIMWNDEGSMNYLIELRGKSHWEMAMIHTDISAAKIYSKSCFGVSKIGTLR